MGFSFTGDQSEVFLGNQTNQYGHTTPVFGPAESQESFTSSGPAYNATYSGVTTPTAPVDPYAKWGGQSAYNNLVSGFNTQKQNVYGTSMDAARSTGSQLNRSILDFLDSQKLGQQAIDQKAVNNEMARSQGVSGVMGMVGRGINSMGRQLASRNAGNSSAAGALANAYGQLGQGEMSKVGNQYAMGNAEVDQAQNAFNVQRASGVRGIQGTKEDAINNIVNSARQSFAELDAQMANASLPERIAIEQEKESVRAQVLGELQQYDSMLNNGVAGIAPSNAEQRRTRAVELARAGTDLGAGAFDYMDEAPLGINSGPYASQLPIFTMPRGRRTA